MSYRVVGLRIEKFVGDVLTGHNFDLVLEKEECERHILCLQREEEKFGKTLLIKVEFSFELDQTYACSSGWTTATYAKTGEEKVANFGGFTHIPKEEIIISEILRNRCLEYDFVKWNLNDNLNDKEYDITIKDTKGRIVASSSFDGKDEWYPRGRYEVNMDLFTSKMEKSEGFKLGTTSYPEGDFKLGQQIIHRR